MDEEATMPRWTTAFEPDLPADAPAKDVLDVLLSMFEARSFMQMAEEQQLIALQHHCLASGWVRRWPVVVRLYKSGLRSRARATTTVVLERGSTTSRLEVEQALSEVLAGVLIRLAFQASPLKSD